MKKSDLLCLTLIGLIAALFLLATACAPATLTITPPPPGPAATPTQIPLHAILLVTDAITPTHLALSGSTLVWADHRAGNADIYGYDLETGHEFPIATGPVYQQQPDVHGQLAVWVESDAILWAPDAIYGHRLDTGQRLRLVEVKRPRDLHLAWPYVVWTEDRSDPGHVMAPLYITPAGVVALDLTTGRITDLIRDGFKTAAALTDQNRLLIYVYGSRAVKHQDAGVVAHDLDTDSSVTLGGIGFDGLYGFGVKGRTVAWSTGSSGMTQVVRLTPDGHTEKLPFPERAWVRAMADEDTVVYVPFDERFQPGGLAAVNVRTGARYELMAEGHPSSVTADAGRIVWSTRDGRIWLAQLPGAAAPTPVPPLPILVTPRLAPTPLPPTEDGLAAGITAVADLPANTGGRYMADPPLAPFDWSPTAPQLAYINDDQLQVATAPDFQPRTLAPGLREAVFPRWSPDGRMLAWAEVVPPDSLDGMVSSNVALMTLAPTPQPRRFLLTGPPSSRGPVGFVHHWRDMGTLLLAGSQGMAAELNLNRGRLKHVVDRSPEALPELVPSGFGITTVAWSPTRPLLVISRLKGNGWSTIILLRSDAGPNTVLWRAPADENHYFHDWSPDGRFFLYGRWGTGWPVATTPTDLCAWDVEMRTGKRWVPNAFGAAWSPTGDRVAVLLTGTPRLDDAGRVIDTDFAVGEPLTAVLAVLNWPDGRLVAQTPAGYWPRLVDGDEAWQEFARRQPVWSPDGKWLAYLGPDDELWVMRADGSVHRRVTQGLLCQAVDGVLSPAARHLTVAWSADGRYLALAIAGHIWVLSGPWGR